VDKANMTLGELFELWLERKAIKLGRSNLASMKSSYQHCKPLWGYKYAHIKAYHMQDSIDHCGCGYATQGAIKALWNHLDKFALELDVTTRNYASLLQSAPIPETSKSPFSEQEVQAMWTMQNSPWADSILFLLYTGFRISEMLDLRKEAVNLIDGTITGGTKTKSGKDRIVPIHSKIRHIVENRLVDDGDYLFSYNAHKCHDTTYRILWGDIMKAAAMQHTPHDCRHTFRSRLDSASANKRCIDLMMGHKSKDVGERVYTHKTIDELRAAIELATD
jgi:integrase